MEVSATSSRARADQELRLERDRAVKSLTGLPPGPGVTLVWACLSAVLGCAFLYMGALVGAQEVGIRLDGRASVAEVVATDHEHRAAFVRVRLRLEGGAAKESDLLAWRGKPSVGDRLKVVHWDGHPSAVRQLGAFPTLPIAGGAGIGTLMSLVSIGCWRRYRRLAREADA